MDSPKGRVGAKKEEMETDRLHSWRGLEAEEGLRSQGRCAGVQDDADAERTWAREGQAQRCDQSLSPNSRGKRKSCQGERKESSMGGTEIG